MSTLPTCVHPGEDLYEFDVPYLGTMLLCWECRREIVLRTHSFREFGLVPVDSGRIDYRCSTCGGEYTSDDAMTCTCPGGKEQCAANAAALKEWHEWATLTIWKPKKERTA